MSSPPTTERKLESDIVRTERVLADRRWFALTDEAWTDFNALLDTPAARTPRLSFLLSETTVFDPKE